MTYDLPELSIHLRRRLAERSGNCVRPLQDPIRQLRDPRQALRQQCIRLLARLAQAPLGLGVRLAPAVLGVAVRVAADGGRHALSGSYERPYALAQLTRYRFLAPYPGLLAQPALLVSKRGASLPPNGDCASRLGRSPACGERAPRA